MSESGISYNEMTVDDFAQHAGIARSTFYVYFEDKGQVLREWVTDVFGGVSRAAKEWYALPADASRAEVERALTNILMNYRPHASLIATVLDASGQDESIREAFDAEMRRQVEGLATFVERKQGEGVIDSSIPAAATAAWLTWMAERGLHKLMAQATEEQLADTVRGYCAIVWKTLYLSE